MYPRRTDLALEAHELCQNEAEPLSGVTTREHDASGYHATVVEISEPRAAEALGKRVEVHGGLPGKCAPAAAAAALRDTIYSVLEE